MSEAVKVALEKAAAEMRADGMALYAKAERQGENSASLYHRAALKLAVAEGLALVSKRITAVAAAGLAEGGSDDHAS